MKRTLTITLLLTLLLLSACKRDEKQYYIGVSQCNNEEWQQQMNAEMEREVRFFDGVKLEIRSIKDDNNRKQIDDIRRFIALKVDLIVVSPNEGAALTPVINEAYELGIPVIVVDRKIASNKYTAFIGTDNYRVGQLVGEYIESINDKSTQHVYEIEGIAGASSSAERHKGFINTIVSHSNIRYIGNAHASWHKKRAEEITDSVLRRHPEINVIFAQNDRMALGAYQAAKKLGKQQDIKIVGVDALAGDSMGIGLVKRGILTATFVNPTGGDKIIQTAMAILQKRPYQREQILSTGLIDKNNANIIASQAESINGLDRKVQMLAGLLDKNLDRYNTQQLLMSLLGLVAFLLIVIAIIAIRAYWLKNRNNELLKKRNEEVSEQRDQMIKLTKQVEEATRAQLDYYTNVSHDLRTPLTLIADPLDMLMQEGYFTPNQQHYLPIIRKNVEVLLNLVNQVLDFRKYEDHMHVLVLSRFDLKQQLTQWLEAFDGSARKHAVKLIRKSKDNEPLEVVMDLHKLECIFLNLMSNALKHTPPKGKITVEVNSITKEEENWFELKVIDSGEGIAPQHIQNIFDRMYQVDSNNGGSGIGLALVKAFVNLHKGTISVDSCVGKGSTFTIFMPVAQPGKITEVAPQQMNHWEAATTHENYPAANTIYEEHPIQENTRLILVIDDNPDICDLLHKALHEEFQVICAPDGKQGLSRALHYIPDLIISDVMMPIMDGVELTRQLKKEMQTCHIPVILLTARNQDEQKIEGFQGGADAYLVKPFNTHVLLARIHNLLENRQLLKNFFADKTLLQQEGASDADQSFIERFRDLLNREIKNTELTVDQLGTAMGLSRIQLYRKVKALTNNSPIELLRMVRMKQARILLTTTEKTITEIATEVGYASASYFSKSFKDTFGENPIDLIKKR